MGDVWSPHRDPSAVVFLEFLPGTNAIKDRKFLHNTPYYEFKVACLKPHSVYVWNLIITFYPVNKIVNFISEHSYIQLIFSLVSISYVLSFFIFNTVHIDLNFSNM